MTTTSLMIKFKAPTNHTHNDLDDLYDVTSTQTDQPKVNNVGEVGITTESTFGKSNNFCDLLSCCFQKKVCGGHATIQARPFYPRSGICQQVCQ